MQTPRDAGSLVLSLEVPEPVVVGLSSLVTIRLANKGDQAISVSRRLNLMEGDLQISAEDSEGTRVFKGWQADTTINRTTLQRGEQIIGVVNLLHTNEGPVFPRPGTYTLRAVYFPMPTMQPISSAPVVVSVRSPLAGAESAVACLLEDQALREAIVLAKADEATESLRTLATASESLIDARLARMLIGQDSDTKQDQDDPLADARQIRALTTPFSNAGIQLAEKFFSASPALTAEVNASASVAAGIARGEPIPIEST